MDLRQVSRRADSSADGCVGTCAQQSLVLAINIKLVAINERNPRLSTRSSFARRNEVAPLTAFRIPSSGTISVIVNETKESFHSENAIFLNYVCGEAVKLAIA
jgi:hypothetical protein